MNLVDAERELGIVFLDMQQWNQSIQSYRNARETLKSIRERHGKVVSRMVAIKETIAIDDFNLLNALSSNDEKLAQELVDEAYAICDKLDVIRPLSPKLRQVYAYVTHFKADAIAHSTGILDVDLNRKALQLFTGLLDEDSTSHYFRCFVVLIGLELADGLSTRGQTEEAKQVETKALKTARGHPEVCYQTAITFAVLANQTWMFRSKLNAQQSDALRRRYAGWVVPLLRAAAAAGFKDARRVRYDLRFASYRSDPAYQAVLMDMGFPDKGFPDTDH